LQKAYLKIDGSSSSEPPRMPEDDLTLADKFASIVTAPFRKSTCQSLRQAFNDLKKSPVLVNENETPYTVQIMQGLKYFELEVTRMTSAIEAGGVASVKALRDARDFLTRDLETQVLQFK